MRLKAKFFVVLLFGLIANLIYAQELPPIDVYTPQNYNADNQNWGVSQSQDKKIYVANNSGLLQFDGERWTLYPSPNETIMRSVNVVDEIIYSGFYMEFGYWVRNEFGTLNYSSLSKNLKTPLIEDEQFWNIIDLDNYILFQSLNRIYIYNELDETFSIINSSTRITKMYEVDGSIYFQRINDGIYKIESGEEILVSNDNWIANDIVINIFDNDDSLLIETQNNGFYVLNENKLDPWSAAINNELKSLSIYNSIQLANGNIALGTISNGLILISITGELIYRIDQNKGISNSTVLSLFEDIDKNIWLGLDNGIDCINMNSPFKVYNDFKGNIGTVYASAISEGNLYLGTNQGLFFKTLYSSDEYEFIEGTSGQVWSLTEIDQTLFCGHNSGTFVISNGEAINISNIQGTWGIKAIVGNPNILLQGNYDGLYVLKKQNNNWSLSNKIDGFDISSRFFEFISKNELLVNHEYKGVFKIKLDNNFTKVEEVIKEPIKGLKSSLVKYNNEILYANQQGVYKYNMTDKSFLKDSLFSNLYNSKSFISGKLIADSKSTKLWGFSRNDIGYITPGKLSEGYEIRDVPLPIELRNSITNYENIFNLYDQNYILGTTHGYLLIDLNKLVQKEYQVDFSQIISSKYQSNLEIENIDKNLEGDFPVDENNIHFTYSLLEFDKYLKPEYQYQLLGMFDTWSEWSVSSEKDFENLPYGNYTFNVRGRVNKNITNNIASYSFTIQRPWFLSNVMIALYLLGILLFSFVMHNVYKQYYKKQRMKLLEKKNRELELQELTNKQQLMRLKNESLTKDVENKNRELAISTMSLIKKNEFLSNIKNELSDLEAVNKTKPVISLIDKNLNNTDDWKMFEEAFNNADKDFLKKVKLKHETLTPNDLRLCAYLRLNLSSKEIAPLLNISPRSVEVKRYRLRKKMNLQHETSLTNYILGL